MGSNFHAPKSFHCPENQIVLGPGYGFSSSNALYSASLSFILLLFLLITFDTWDFYFESNLSLVLLVKVLLIKRACKVLLYSPKHEEITFLHNSIFVFILYLIEAILSKKCQEVVGWKKDIKSEFAIWGAWCRQTMNRCMKDNFFTLRMCSNLVVQLRQ